MARSGSGFNAESGVEVRTTATATRQALGLALICVFSAGGAAPTGASDGEFRLLKLDGYFVKWGGRAFGTGATVSYAFATAPRRFDSARNCGELIPIDELTARHGVSLATLREEAAAAFRVWEEAANIRFVVSDDPDRADILIGAQGQPVGRAYANVAYRDGSENGVKAIDQALVCLNPEQRWKVGFDGDIEVYDIRYTLVHEIGHAIGLDHPGPVGQVMSFRYSEEYYGLQPGDFRGAQLLYGPSTRNLVAAVPASEPDRAPTEEGPGVIP